MIKKIYFILIAVLLLYSCNEKPNHPNVILIMTDDQGYGDIAIHGNPYIQTPNMDKLHEQSIRLENFHVCPTCSPTRAQLMTGKYNHRVGVWHTVLGRERIRKTEFTMANAFSENGYATGIFGKWHLGDDYPHRPSDRGFTQSVVHKAGSVCQTPDYWDNDRMNDTYYCNNKPKKYQGFCTDVFFNEAISFIKKNKEKPFFVYLPTSAPHGPNNIVQKWANKYLKKGLNEDISNFYASIERVDHNVGKLKKFLNDTGLSENTILLFLSDNGTTMPNDHNRAGMRGCKGDIYDGGHRVPCFVYWPAKNLYGNKIYKELTSAMDLFPTLKDICNLKIDKPIDFDGESLKPLLFNQPHELNKRYLIVENQRVPHPVKWRKHVVMHKNWRLVNGKELYNMDTDFAQQKNIAKQYPDLVKQMRKQYEQIWNDISTNDNEYQPLIIGHKQSEETLLCAIDWYWNNNNDKQNLIVEHEAVRNGKKGNGTWPVEFAHDGNYVFQLYRWPKESGLALNASTPEVSSNNNDIALKEWGTKPIGKVLNITKAKIKVNNVEKEIEVNPSKNFAEIKLKLPQGTANVKSWFYTSDGDTLGAYYVYVKKEN
ncbi:N-acetylgalactosamine 6-sulfate sulfatase [Prolixibacteraceae bacterium JC049]|nr:N-acetylgalactosamine 6-sulfate sulfatase [Prolixibacteraceae bacterium JC049]